MVLAQDFLLDLQCLAQERFGLGVLAGRYVLQAEDLKAKCDISMFQTEDLWRILRASWARGKASRGRPA